MTPDGRFGPPESAPDAHPPGSGRHAPGPPHAPPAAPAPGGSASAAPGDPAGPPPPGWTGPPPGGWTVPPPGWSGPPPPGWSAPPPPRPSWRAVWQLAHPLDWSIMAAALAAFALSFVDFFHYDARGQLLAACHFGGGGDLPPAVQRLCTGDRVSAWHGFFGWFGVLLVLAAGACTAVAVFAPKVPMPVPARLAGVVAAILGIVSVLMCLAVMPAWPPANDLGVPGDQYGALIGNDLGPGWYVAAVAAIAAAGLGVLRYLQTGGQLLAIGRPAAGPVPRADPALFAPPGWGPPGGPNPSVPPGAVSPYPARPGLGYPPAGYGPAGPAPSAGFGPPSGYEPPAGYPPPERYAPPQARPGEPYQLPDQYGAGREAASHGPGQDGAPGAAQPPPAGPPDRDGATGAAERSPDPPDPPEASGRG